MDNLRSEQLTIGKLGSIKRKAVSLAQEGLVQADHLHAGHALPFVIQPIVDGLDLAAWADNNKAYVETLLLEHRALLFRNFNIRTEAQFHGFVKITSDGELLEYRDRSSPRHEVGEKIYTSTDYPADQRIFLHNEGTYWLTWPRKIYFCCVAAPEQGGETPIADCRKVFERIDPGIRERFVQKKWMLVRNYNDGFGLPWQTVFQTADRAVVDDYCRRNDIQAEWKGGDRLRTRQVREVVVSHPHTGELLWFNHAAFFHVSSLESATRDAFLAGFSEEDLPYNTYYGDGSAIELAALDQIREAYQQETVSFPWREGDVLMLDNMSVAHGRAPFVGHRQVLAAMSEPYTRTLL